MRGNQLSCQWQVTRPIKVGPNALALTEIDKRREKTGIRTIHRDLEAYQTKGFLLYWEKAQPPSHPAFKDTFKFQFLQKLKKLNLQRKAPKAIRSYLAFLRPGMNKILAVPRIWKIKEKDSNYVSISIQRACFWGIQLNSTDRFHGSPL